MKLTALLPGCLLALSATAFCWWLHAVLPTNLQPLFGLTLLSMTLGLFVGNLFILPPSIQPGLKFSFSTLLKWAIVLLGFKFSRELLAAMGWPTFALVLGLIIFVFSFVRWIGTKMGVPKNITWLLAIGTCICGNTAISAAGPVIGASDEEMSFSIATNTLFGTAAVFLYPLMGHLFGFSDLVFGLWSGTAVNDTSQVVAAGYAFSSEAGNIATAVKLIRNSLMGVLLVWLSIQFGTKQTSHPVKRVVGNIPWFVWGFMLMALVKDLGVLNELFWLTKSIAILTKVLISTALFAVGAQTQFQQFRKIGLKPFLVGLGGGLVLCFASLFLILTFWN